MEANFSNYSLYGIHNEAARFTWAGFATTTILSGQIGSLIILGATIKYKAIKLHRFTVTIIQHIAVCDMISSLVLVTFLISLLANKSILGEAICHFRSYLAFYSFPASLHLMAALTTSKYLLVKFPLNDGRWSKRRAHNLCFGIWIYCAILPLMMLIVDKDDITFDYRDYACRYRFSSAKWGILCPIIGTILTVLPNLVVPTTTGLLIYEARKVAQNQRENLRRQGLMTVILTAVVFCLSVIPISLYIVLQRFIVVKNPGFFHVYGYRFAMSALSINVMYNFYLYCMTVYSFRQFLTRFWVEKVRGMKQHRKIKRPSTYSSHSTQSTNYVVKSSTCDARSEM